MCNNHRALPAEGIKTIRDWWNLPMIWTDPNLLKISGDTHKRLRSNSSSVKSWSTSSAGKRSTFFEQNRWSTTSSVSNIDKNKWLSSPEHAQALVKKPEIIDSPKKVASTFDDAQKEISSWVHDDLSRSLSENLSFQGIAIMSWSIEMKVDLIIKKAIEEESKNNQSTLGEFASRKWQNEVINAL